MKVLYVDDAPYTRLVLQRCLESAGYEARGASGGEEALAYLEQEQPDILVTDLLMAGMDGKELIKHVARLYPALPVVVLSADVQQATRVSCEELGAKAVFSKGNLYPDGKSFAELLDQIVKAAGS